MYAVYTSYVDYNTTRKLQLEGVVGSQGIFLKSIISGKVSSACSGMCLKPLHRDILVSQGNLHL